MKNVITNSHENATILDTHFTGTHKRELLKKIKQYLSKFDNSSLNQAQLSRTRLKPLMIVTPNPEQLMHARKDLEFARILNNADYSLPDAYGIVLADRFLNFYAPRNIFLRYPVILLQGALVGLVVVLNRSWIERDLKVIKGREFFLELIKLADENKWRVFLLGGVGGVSEKAAEVLSKKYKRIKWKFADGPMLNTNGKPEDGGRAKDRHTRTIHVSNNTSAEKKVANAIKNFKPHLLFVAFGAPKAEKWMYRMRPRLAVGVMMAVGRTYDYVAGLMEAPPSILSKNFEWLWTGIRYPKRLGRVLTAFPLFPYEVLKWKLKHREDRVN